MGSFAVDVKQLLAIHLPYFYSGKTASAVRLTCSTRFAVFLWPACCLSLSASRLLRLDNNPLLTMNAAYSDALTPSSIKGVWGGSMAPSSEAEVPTVGREGESGQGLYVGELLSSSLIFYPSA